MTNVFLSPDDPRLIAVAEPVLREELGSTEVVGYVERMLQVASGEQADRRRSVLVGLAAPQIGIAKRIILVDRAADGRGSVGDLRVYFNPELVERSAEEAEWYEGCFSTGPVCGVVSRPVSITVRAMNLDGAPIRESHSGYVARIFQHEIDHLNGIEFVSHIADDSRLHWVEPEEFPTYRDKEAWREWPRKCSREQWNEIKGIDSARRGSSGSDPLSSE
jgi:peptide deformylase